jgi:hypothetical protein
VKRSEPRHRSGTLDQEPHKIRLWNGAAYKRGPRERQVRGSPRQRRWVGSRLIFLDLGNPEGTISIELWF